MSAPPERSPLAPRSLAHLPDIAGVKLGTARTGMKYAGRPDVLVALLDPGSTVAGVFTTSRTRSAPVEWCASNIARHTVRAVVVNAGNANAFTGRRGIRAVEETVDRAASVFGCEREDVYVASTGVIGEPLDASRIAAVLGEAAAGATPSNWPDAARAIMTTDTFPKLATATAKIGGRPVRINGIAKGSGMIAPDMATMLAFVFTDAALPPAALQSLLQEGVGRSFNCITVDGDTSTSDTVLLVATGSAADACEHDVGAFAAALDAVLKDLALQVVRDGEGAQKLITIAVRGAETDEAARRIGLSIGNSPLVKTAIAGEDANWGRIVMAVGKAGEAADRDRLQISIGGVLVARDGEVATDYREADLVPHMKGRDIRVEVDVGVAEGEATIWTCDLTHGYIDINASYRS